MFVCCCGITGKFRVYTYGNIPTVCAERCMGLAFLARRMKVLQHGDRDLDISVDGRVQMAKSRGWLSATSPSPSKVEAFNAVTDEIESVPGFHEYFHADHELHHMPFGNELRLRLDAERVKRWSGSTRRRQLRHVLLDPLLWHGLEVAMTRRTPPRP